MPAKKKVINNTRSKKQKNPTSKDTCFILMPFGEWFDFYHDEIYVPAITASGLIPKRADDLYRPSAIVNDIWSLTHQARIVLADLSGKNPNVFYELGMAHAIAKPAILVTDSMADVPFDLRALRVIVYEKNAPNWGAVLREKIQISIREILDSPLESVLPTFIKVHESTSSDQLTTTKVEKELVLLKQDMETLKLELQARGRSSSPLRDSLRSYISFPERRPAPPPVNGTTDEIVEFTRRKIRDGDSMSSILSALKGYGWGMHDTEILSIIQRAQDLEKSAGK